MKKAVAKKAVAVRGWVRNRLFAVTITNDAGGTEILPCGNYRIEIIRTLHRGSVMGRLLNPEQVEVARKLGTTGHGRTTFDPSIVIFYKSEFTADTE